MKIKISNLKAGTHAFIFTGKVHELGFTEPFSDAYELKVSLEKSSHQIIVDAQGWVNGNVKCDRCGKDYSTKLNFSFRTVYLYSQVQTESDDESIKFITHETDSIDIRDDVYDFAHLSLPMKNLCKDDCRGLCSACGQDFNEGTCECAHKNSDEQNGPFSVLKKLNNKLK